MSVPFHISPTTSQSIDVRRKGGNHSCRVIYPQRHSRVRIARTIERSSDTSDEEPKFVPRPSNPVDIASISMSVPMMPGTASSIGDFPDIPYSAISTKCLGEIYSDRICFKLQANVAKIFCPFDYTKSEENQIILTIDPPKVSLPLNINGRDIVYHGQEIDITELMQDGVNHFVFNTISIQMTIVASVQWRMSRNYDFLVNKIMTEYPPMSLPLGAQYITDRCPIGHVKIKNAGRGADCTHLQCFDLLAFLKRAKETNNWGCPVCGLTLSIANLRYDPTFLKNCALHLLGDSFGDGEFDSGQSF